MHSHGKDYPVPCGQDYNIAVISVFFNELYGAKPDKNIDSINKYNGKRISYRLGHDCNIFNKTLAFLKDKL